MSETADSRREDRRYALPAGVGLSVSFAAPDGSRHRLPVIELSARGLAFRDAVPIPGIASGAMLGGATIALEDIEIRGHLAVLRMTGDDEARCVYGAQFYPQSEDDQNRFITLVGRLAQLPEF